MVLAAPRECSPRDVVLRVLPEMAREGGKIPQGTNANRYLWKIPDEVRRSTNQYRERLYKEANEFRKLEKEHDQLLQAKRVEQGFRPGPSRGQARAKPGQTKPSQAKPS